MKNYANEDIRVSGCPGCAYARHEFKLPCGIAYENDKYWGFYGGCDQGRYTFGVMRGRKDYGIIEPLEWK